MLDSIGAVAIVHASIYFLLAGAPFILFHYRRRLFLGSMGAVAMLAYAGSYIGGDGTGIWRRSVALAVVVLGGPFLVVGASILLEGRSHFSWAVATYAVEVFVLRSAALPNDMTHGDAGVLSPLTSSRQFALPIAIGAVLLWSAVFLLARKRGVFWHAERDLESTRLAAVLGVGGWRARLPPALLAGGSLSLAAVVFLLWQPRILPASFALCSSLVALTAALIVRTPRAVALFGFAAAFVGLRILIGFSGGSMSTQVAELIGGGAIVLFVATNASLPLRVSREE